MNNNFLLNKNTIILIEHFDDSAHRIFLLFCTVMESN